MRAVIAELGALRLHGMVETWADLIEQNNAELERSLWLVEQMLRAEMTERATRSVSHQLNAAAHRDLAGFDFEVAPVDRACPVGTRAKLGLLPSSPCEIADKYLAVHRSITNIFELNHRCYGYRRLQALLGSASRTRRRLCSS